MRNIPYMGIVFILAVSIILVIPATVFGLCALFDYRLVYGEYAPASFALSFENAPEGAVGIEPLICLANGEYSALGEFVTERADNRVTLSESPLELQKRQGAFKAAYMDENGNVLGITKAARMRYGTSEAPRLAANGDKLEYFTGKIADWQAVVLIIAVLLEPLAFTALIVVIVLAAVNRVCETSEREKVMNVKLKRTMIITAAVAVKLAMLTAMFFLLPRVLANEDSETLYKIKDIVHSRVTPSARRFPEKMRMLGASGSVSFEDGQMTICSSIETEEDFSDVIAKIPEITKEVNELITQSERLSYPATDIEIYIEHWSEWNMRIFPKQSRITLGINERISFAEAVEYCRGFENIDVGGYWGFEVDIPDNVGELFADFDNLCSLRIDSIMREDTETAARELARLEDVEVTLGTFTNGEYKQIL